MLKEKCIYYNSVKGGYYLVLSVSNMIYGRYGDILNPSYLDACMYTDRTGLKFKIDNIIINMESYRNYDLEDSEINDFELVKKLTDEEFYPMELLIHSSYKFPNYIIDVEKNKNNVTNLVDLLRNKKEKLCNLQKEIRNLEKDLFKAMKK